MFDIATLETADTGFLHLKNPANEEAIFLGSGEGAKPVGITFHAPGSDAYVTAETRRTNRALVRSKRKIDLTADLLRDDQIQFLADVTVSFDGLTYSRAKDVEGAAMFRALYGDRKFGWVVDQANAFLADWGNFSTTSPQS